MNVLDLKRDIVPIWKPSYEAAKTSEVLSLKQAAVQEGFQLQSDSLFREFLVSRDIGRAADLLNSSVLEGRDDIAKIAAEYIVDSPERLPALEAVSRKVLGLPALGTALVNSNEIAFLKARLKKTPHNPIAWVDLARAYTIINEREKSERAMWVALRYSHSHRWITRMATRFFVHFEELGKAHRVLLRNENLRSDPWLLSAELAVSRLAGRPLKHWNQAKKLVASSVEPIHLSELSSSMATSEILGGADKKARAFFKQSLIAPTSNSLAQIKWADRSFKLGFGKQIESSLAHAASAFEAKYWEAYEKKDMQLALGYAEEWWRDEPYSAAPPRAITYLASIINDMPLLLRVAGEGLKANPGDITLRLNYIFAQIGTLGYTGEVDPSSLHKIVRTLRAIMHGDDKDEAAHAAANIGMLAYRIGDFELGKSYYDQAESYFERTKNPSQLFLLINHLREALISEAGWPEQITQRIKKFIEQPRPVISTAAGYYLNKVEALKDQPGNWRERFSLAFKSDNLVGSAPEVPKVLTFEEVSTKFWLPEDFIASRDILQSLDLTGGRPKERLR